MKFYASFFALLSVNSLSKASNEGVGNTLVIPSYHRELEVPVLPSVCVDNVTVNFGIPFDEAVFASEFQPQCNCTDTSNFNEVFSELPVPTENEDLQGFLDALNVAFGQVNGESEWTCENQLAICYNDGTICGLVSTTVSTSVQGRETNLTLADLTEAVNDPSVFVDIKASIETCILYTTGVTGATCYSLELVGEKTATCTLSYNEKDCPCSVELTDGKQCITSTCNGEGINTCTGTGADLDGPFGILQLYASDTPLSFTVESDETVKPASINGDEDSGTGSITFYYLHFLVLIIYGLLQ